MNKIIVTTGQPFTDIDALASALAYTELLECEGEKAQAVLPGSLNKSVTDAIRSWQLKFSTKTSTAPAKYVLVDISEPKFFADFVTEEDISEIYDHRYGFESYWKDRLGKNSHIEMVGSCATLIWEEFVKRNRSENISDTSANLLLTAIASNTLNFKASVTTPRDEKAFKELLEHSNLPKNWFESYFEEHDKDILNDVNGAIINDTKNTEGPVIGQLEMWNNKLLFTDHLEEVQQSLESFGKEEWFLTSPCISEGKNYLFTKNPEIKRLLKRTINATFEGDIGTTDKLWLRKEISKRLKDLS